MNLAVLSSNPVISRRERTKSIADSLPKVPVPVSIAGTAVARASLTSSGKISLIRRRSSEVSHQSTEQPCGSLGSIDASCGIDVNFSLSHVTKLKSDEKDFNRKSIAWLMDGRLVILNHGSNEMKVFDTKYHPVLSRRLTENCRAVTSASGCDVAVTCDRRVYFYNLTNKKVYETSKCFILNGNSHGISTSGSGFAVAVDVGTSKKHIAILDEKGKTIHTIRKYAAPHESVPLLFHIYIAVNFAKRVVYVSDVKNDKLVCISFTEKRLWERELSGKPRGICLIDDYIIVGTANQQLVLLNLEGAIVRILALLEYEPECIAFNPLTKRLAVSQYFRGWVHVYQIT
ncbi:hypothetical protein FSP39_025095 [Pinctada imbricata]|uniref:Uncharacterized protein n=1 Tax=Pinctada imbricata TaxID=66713 RepID=A0AA88XIP6_PINIB|nr:hypothetical protein FSP39_025095 [Pinctada imbricata]